MCLSKYYRKWRYKERTSQGEIDDIKNKYYQRIMKNNEARRRRKEKEILDRYNRRRGGGYDLRYTPLHGEIGYSTSYIR